jgi:hypothetical protein
MKNLASIEDFIAMHNKGTFGVYCATITQPKLTGGKKCPFANRNVFKVTYIQNAILGISYEGAIKGAEKRSGVEQGTFEAAQLPWGSWKNYPYTIEHKGTNYLRLFQNKATKMISDYYIDGVLVNKDSEQFAELSLYLPKKAPSKKQTEAGIDEQEQVTPLAYKYDSIACLAQKDNVYVRNVGVDVDSEQLVLDIRVLLSKR